MSDYEVEAQAESTGSDTYPLQCSALRKGGHVVIKGHPCKVVDMSTSKTGKHGHAKVHLVALDIFTGKKMEDLCPSTHNVSVPNVKREEYQVLDVTEDGYFSLMNQANEVRDDIKLPGSDTQYEQLGQDIKAAYDDGKEILVTILFSMGEQCAVAWKEMNSGGN
jgi:translation initiation factor 5A